VRFEELGKKNKATHVTDHAGLLRIPHCLGNQLTNGGKFSDLRIDCNLLPRNINSVFVLISVRD
jgi:hypothetical protein